MLKYRIKIISDFCKEKGAVFNRSFFIFTVNYTIKCNRRGRKKKEFIQICGEIELRKR